MKIERTEAIKQFDKIILTIETKKEFDFLWGVFRNKNITPEKSDHFDNNIDTDIFELLNKFRR